MPARKARVKAQTVIPNRSKLIFLRSVLWKWARRNCASFPWRHTRNLFHGLAAEVMLQRTKAEQVVPVYSEFVRLFPTPKDAAKGRRNRFEKLLKPLGLEW